ncbi:Anti-anti-sigma regulatory factor (antagonist of anti-sigma factor) [Thermomonospora echinospora]|uniref:Anti-anti-sigma regulatory factor (Antagonist of anti-sigma factor) n=1 Tax=Thermomonospora echinospora TaxID=1992 RepID=A0A1H5SU33_9ACTN|nr:STAS domain-containing protein [Thermomonospora echinospora]SEF53478.1 Anti-anti-sigma regulatory factor (antagonist of anti-sigma factor) [Thermomonospora echinospora]
MLADPTTPQSAPPGTDLLVGGASAERPAAGPVVGSFRRGPFTVLKMAGPLQAGTVVTAEAELLSTIVLAPPPLHLALDLTEVTAIDARGAVLLAKTRFAVRAARGTLHLVAPTDSPVYTALHLGTTGSVMRWATDLTDLLARHAGQDHPAPAERLAEDARAADRNPGPQAVRPVPPPSTGPRAGAAASGL